MTYTALIKKYSSHIDRFEVELLLSHATKRPREFFIAHPEFTLTFFEYIRFKRMLKKRFKGVPIAYMTGKKEFYGLDFDVNKYTLVPRPDTEMMVENAISTINKQQSAEDILLIDVGTGSGCVPVAIMKSFTHKNIKTNGCGSIEAFATDISRRALRAAKRNAKKHNVDIQFFRGNLLSPLFSNKTIQQYNNKTIILTANLPYLTEQQFNEEPSIQHEPKTALVADDNGLALYKELLLQIKNNFSKHTVVGFFEIDPIQTDEINRIISSLFPNAQITLIKDLADNNRCIKFSLN